MSIIDIHVHFSNIESFRQTANEVSAIDYSAAGLRREFADNDVVLGVGMGVTEQTQGAFPDHNSPNPMGLDLEETVPDFLMECVGINPRRLVEGDPVKELERIEARLQSPQVAGIKLYAGYYHYYVHDKVYGPIYELARQYNLPVVIHTGDTYSMNGLLKYSHPLTVDELALQQRGVTFMLCHLGDPWVMDAAEVVSKNPNVYADLSGLVVGDRNHFDRFMNEQLFMDHFRRALIYADHYDKMLFGTDWPLAQIGLYAEFIRRLVPERYHHAVFYQNALDVFPRVRERLSK